MTLGAHAPAFRRRSTLERLLLDPSLEIGAGGEAVVWHVPGDSGLVAKLYHEPAIERARKIARMLAAPPAMPAGTAIAWPCDLLIDARGGFAGFVMPLAVGPRIFEFYNPVTRRATAPGFHAGRMHRAGRNLAAAFDAIHAAGYVVGDVNESNVIVSPQNAAVTLVDADSWQVPDGDAVFRSRVGKAEFTPPELQGVDFGAVDRTPEHDRFGLAVLLFLLLMEGTHPFAARFDGEAPPVEERIARGLFPHAPGSTLRPPRMAPRFDWLHPDVQALFVRAFVDGHRDPSARPAAAEWRDAVEAAEAAMVGCAANPRHLFHAHSPACPWCERAALLGGRDPFPAHVPAALPAPVVHRRRLPPVRAPFASPHLAPGVRGTPGHHPAHAPPAHAHAGGLAQGHAGRPAHAAAGVSPFGVHPQPVTVQPATPAPRVFGVSGVLNPLVFLLPSLSAMAVSHTAGISLFAGVTALVSLVLLAAGMWRHVKMSTFLTALMAMFLAAAFAAIPGAQADRGRSFAPDDTLPPEPAPVMDTMVWNGSASGAAGGPAADAGGARTQADFLLPDVDGLPVSKTDTAMPALPDTVAATMTAGEPRALGAPDVDSLPALLDAKVVARAMGTSFRRLLTSDSTTWSLHAPPDTAVLWLRVGGDGRVPDNETQVISSTSREAAQAAKFAVPYLRYAPARKNGAPVAVWVTQRFVFRR